MKAKHLYNVTFTIQRKGFHNYLINIEAYNQTEAKAQARQLWNDKNGYMFYLTAQRVTDNHQPLFDTFKTEFNIRRIHKDFPNLWN